MTKLWSMALLALMACGTKESAETDPTSTEDTDVQDSDTRDTDPQDTDAALNDCDDPAKNPLGVSCVEDFLAACFDPVGECTYAQAGMNITTTWENGATLQVEAGMSTTIRFVSSDGTTCVSGIAEVGKAGCVSQTSYRREADGATQVWCTYQDGSLEVTCDDGTVIDVSAEQSTTANACQPGGSCTPA